MIWADLQNFCRWRYRVMPLNPTLGTYTQKLQREMGTICRLSASAGRPDFYEVEAPGGWYYVHVHHPSRTILLGRPFSGRCPRRPSKHGCEYTYRVSADRGLSSRTPPVLPICRLVEPSSETGSRPPFHLSINKVRCGFFSLSSR